MLERKAIKKMEQWLEDDDKTALLIEGARQIGKTTLIRAFAEKHFKSIIEINFLEKEDAKALFDGEYSSDILVSRITAYSHKEIIPGETLLFLDEIQECPDARTAIKFLVDAGNFRVIESGSLLGINYKEVKSFPVGYESKLQMYPMDLEEFFISNGISKGIIASLRECYENRKPVDKIIHDTLNKMVYTYLVVGGMPQVVQAYVRHHDIAEAVRLQRDILRLYRLDIAKYAPAKEKENIRRIFDMIPEELNSKNRRFILSDLSREARMRDLRSDFIWLADAAVAYPCYNITEPVLPLKLNDQSSLMKFFQNDTGLLCAGSMEDIQLALLKGDVTVNLGSVLENYFAQEFAAHGFFLRFFNKRSMGELDFIIQDGTRVIPVEIKSGSDYKKHAALDTALSQKGWKLDEAVVFCGGNIESENGILYLPWYMSMFFCRTIDGNENMIYQVDLSALKA